MMKAAVYQEFGTADVLKVKQVQKPVPKENEILVKIKATTVNSGDVKIRSKNVPWFFRLPMSFLIGFRTPKSPILGNTLSGIVQEKGSKVTLFSVGDEVYGSTGFTFGTYAEYIAVPQTAPICKKPPSLTFQEAASIPFGAQSALHFLKAANIHQGDRVLVYGASGAVGSSAVQIAKAYGAVVTGVTTKTQLMKQLGVKSINYQNENYLTSGPFDIFFDTTGIPDLNDNVNLLSENGRLILLSITALNWYFRALWKNMTGSKKLILGVAEETKQNLLEISELLEAKKYKPIIDRVYTLNQIKDAHAYVEQGHKKGAVVITI